MSFHLFHKWSKWEQFEWKGKTCMTGILAPKDTRGKWFDLVELRQKRKCTVCGKMQEEVIG